MRSLSSKRVAHDRPRVAYSDTLERSYVLNTLRLLEPKSNNLIALAKSPRAVWLSELSEPLSELSDGIR